MTRDDTIDMMLGAAVVLVAYMAWKQGKRQVPTDPAMVGAVDPATIVDSTGLVPYGNWFDFDNLLQGVI
jgi:hypothetical protein